MPSRLQKTNPIESSSNLRKKKHTSTMGLNTLVNPLNDHLPCDSTQHHNSSQQLSTSSKMSRIRSRLRKSQSVRPSLFRVARSSPEEISIVNEKKLSQKEAKEVKKQPRKMIKSPTLVVEIHRSGQNSMGVAR